MLNSENNVTNPYIRRLAWGPENMTTSWPMYFVNGFKFHTAEHSQGKKTNNSGVSVRGDAGTGENTWHGVLRQILELEYTGDVGKVIRRVVLFKCDWYDPGRPEGTRKHNNYNIIEVNQTRKFGAYDPFILAQDARQVYFTKYPGKCRKNWMLVFPSKSRGRLEVEDIPDDAYQVENTPPIRTVNDDSDALGSLQVESNDFDIVDDSHRIQNRREVIHSDDEDEDEDEDDSSQSE